MKFAILGFEGELEPTALENLARRLAKARDLDLEMECPCFVGKYPSIFSFSVSHYDDDVYGYHYRREFPHTDCAGLSLDARYELETRVREGDRIAFEDAFRLYSTTHFSEELKFRERSSPDEAPHQALLFEIQHRPTGCFAFLNYIATAESVFLKSEQRDAPPLVREILKTVESRVQSRGPAACYMQDESDTPDYFLEAVEWLVVNW